MKRIIPFILAGLVLTTLSAQNQGSGSFVQEGIASWYGAEFEGRPTASGEIFNTSLFTAAHPTLQFGTVLKVTNKHNNRTVIVRVNDRGPFVANRIIDVSMAAAQQLDMIKTGTAPVLVESLSGHQTSDNGAVYQNQQGTVLQPQEQTEFSTSTPNTQPANTVVYPPAPPSVQNQTGGIAVLKGAVPGDNSAKLYRIQVGSYIQPKNAVETFEKLRNVGLNPAYEKYNDYYRVVLSGIRNTEIQSVAEKLGQAGFREALVKEEN